jgi:hypothetical protein
MYRTDQAFFETDQVLGPGSYEGEAPAPPRVAPPAVTTAITANRRLAPSLGWGCIVVGRVRAMLVIRLLLGLPCEVNESEADLAAAIAVWQHSEGLPVNGQLDARTWERMRLRVPQLTPGRFTPRQWTVRHGGAVLGVIDKIAPYQLFYVDAAGRRTFGSRPPSPVAGGAQIELAFRITNKDGVSRAAIDRFRWIQVVSYNWDVNPLGAYVRRAGAGVDPARRTKLTPDPHPYYWYENLPPGVQPGLHVNCYLQRPVPGGRFCYDLCFFDAPQAPLSFAQPRHRYWANYELALVGVLSGSASGRTRNVVLTAINWGYDIVLDRGVPIVKLNAVGTGVHGGSVAFKRTVTQEMSRVPPAYPTHCFVGTGWGRSAGCR